MPNVSFNREPAVWIGLLGAIAVAIVHSGVLPALTANSGAADVLITAVVGILIRFFVSPVVKAPAVAK